MLPLKYTTLSLLTGFAFFTSPCAAQINQQIKLQFITFPAYLGENPIELYTGEGESLTIELPSTSLSPVYTLKNVPSCILGQTVVNEQGKDSFIKFGETPALTSNEQIILVTLSGDEASEGLTLTPFNSTASGFNGGKYLLMNASKVDIAGQIGTNRFLLNPNKHTLEAPKPSKKEDNREYLYIKMYFRKGGSARPFYSNIWRFNDRVRCLVFIYHDPNTKQLRTRTIRDFI